MDSGLLEQRSQHLDKELTPGITTIGDAVLLGKVLGNLISNAPLFSGWGRDPYLVRLAGRASSCDGGKHRSAYRGGRPAPSV